MKKWKGLLVNRKKGPLSDITAANIQVIEKPLVETDPTVGQHIKSITAQDIQSWVDGFNNNIISGSITGEANKTVTLTRRDGTTLQFSFTDNEGIDSDDYINGLSFNNLNGVLTATTFQGATVTASFDGRYALLGHTHDFDKYVHWGIQLNDGIIEYVNSQQILNLIAGNNISMSRSGKNITINSSASGNIEGTISITSNTTLLPSHNQKTLLCKNNAADIIITIPTGLGKDFTCNFISVESGSRFTQIIPVTGFTLKAPHGRKLLTDYPCNFIKETDNEIGHLQGELTP